MLLYVFIAIGVLLILAFSSYKRLACADRPDSLEFKFFGTNGYVVKVMSVLMLIFLCVLTGARARSIGNDTENYATYFELIAKKGITDELNVEKGYQLICWLVSKIFSTPHGFFMVVAIFSYAVLGRMIYKHSKNIGFSVALFFSMFFSAYMNTIRQGISMAMVLIAYFLIKNGKTKRAVVLILAACLLHKSAIVAMVFVIYKVIPKKFRLVFPTSIVLALLGFSGILFNVLKIVSLGYASYLNPDEIGVGRLATAWNFAQAVVFFIIANKAYKDGLKNKKLDKQAERDCQLPMVAFSCLLLVTSLGFTMAIFNRLATYFLFITVIEFPNALEKCKFKNRSLVMWGISLALIAFFFAALILRPDWNRICPYQFWS